MRIFHLMVFIINLPPSQTVFIAESCHKTPDLNPVEHIRGDIHQKPTSFVRLLGQEMVKRCLVCESKRSPSSEPTKDLGAQVGHTPRRHPRIMLDRPFHNHTCEANCVKKMRFWRQIHRAWNIEALRIIHDA